MSVRVADSGAPWCFSAWCLHRICLAFCLYLALCKIGQYADNTSVCHSNPTADGFVWPLHSTYTIPRPEKNPGFWLARRCAFILCHCRSRVADRVKSLTTVLIQCLSNVSMSGNLFNWCKYTVGSQYNDRLLCFLHYTWRFSAFSRNRNDFIVNIHLLHYK